MEKNSVLSVCGSAIGGENPISRTDMTGWCDVTRLRTSLSNGEAGWLARGVVWQQSTYGR